MTPRQTINYLAASLKTRYRRRFSKHVRLVDPRLRVLHERLERVDPEGLAEQPVEDARFVVIDTETTGLQAYGGDEIVSLAMIEMAGLELTGKAYATLVNPGRPIPSESTAIHGICDDDVAGGPRLTEILEEVVDFIGQGVIVGHHIDFDLRFLNRTLQEELLTQLYHPHLDTMLLYTGSSGRIGHYTLEEVTAHCGVTVVARHSAEGDALATARVFQYLAAKLVPARGRVIDLASIQHELGHFAAPA